MGISISSNYLKNEPEISPEPTVFSCKPINHSLTRAGLSATSEFRLWKQLALHIFKSRVSPTRRTIPGKIERFLSTKNPTKMAAIFPNWWRLGSVRIGCMIHQAPDLPCIRASEGLAPRFCNADINAILNCKKNERGSSCSQRYLTSILVEYNFLHYLIYNVII